MRVTLTEQVRPEFWGGAFAGTGRTPVFTLEVSNRGLAAVQVVTFWLEVIGFGDPMTPLRPKGPVELPAGLDGYNQLFWTVDRDPVLALAAVPAGREVTVRARVLLGNGSVLTSRRIRTASVRQA